MKKRPAQDADDALRRRAETCLCKELAKDLPVETPTNTKRLLHELQVHQIELELQNEELLKAKAEVDVHLEKYIDLYDFAPVGYFSIDEKGVILEANLKAASLLGVERSLLPNSRFQLFIAPQSRAAFPAFLEATFSDHKIKACEALLMRNEQPPFWVELQAICAKRHGDNMKCCRLAIIDISSRKREEETQIRAENLSAANQQLSREITQHEAARAALEISERQTHLALEEAQELQRALRKMSHQLLSVEENLRKKISNELHDNVCQILVSINLHLSILVENIASKPEHRNQIITNFSKLVEDSVNTLHRFAQDLRPSTLQDLGLVRTLHSYIRHFPRLKDQRIEFTAFDGVEALNEDKRTVLYRITQEALINASKYANATIITVNIRKSAKGVSLEIADNGKGFSSERLLAAQQKRRLGILGMRERMEMIGGSLTVESEPGKGVRIQALVPS